MQRDRNLVLADRLDRRIHHDLRTVDGDAVSGERGDDVARGHRAVKLAGFGSLTQHGERLAFQLRHQLVGVALGDEVARLEVGAHRLELALVVLGRAQRLALRQQEIAGIAVAHFHDVADLAEAADTIAEWVDAR